MAWIPSPDELSFRRRRPRDLTCAGSSAPTEESTVPPHVLRLPPGSPPPHSRPHALTHSRTHALTQLPFRLSKRSSCPRERTCVDLDWKQVYIAHLLWWLVNTSGGLVPVFRYT